MSGEPDFGALLEWHWEAESRERAAVLADFDGRAPYREALAVDDAGAAWGVWVRAACLDPA